jgi:hypothetical protein
VSTSASIAPAANSSENGSSEHDVGDEQERGAHREPGGDRAGIALIERGDDQPEHRGDGHRRRGGAQQGRPPGRRVVAGAADRQRAEAGRQRRDRAGQRDLEQSAHGRSARLCAPGRGLEAPAALEVPHRR